jgi:hypothetical protein
MPETTDTRTEKGISLARGPALILGTVLLAAGLYFLYKQHFFPRFSNFPNGKAPVDGKVFGIFGANGWTGMLTAVGGGLLLFGAAQHLLAKAMSLIVGVALAAAAIIALTSGRVLGLAAANHWTEIGWGVAAAILLFNTAVPRRRTTVATDDTLVGRRHETAIVPVAGAGAAGAEPAGAEATRPIERDPVGGDHLEPEVQPGDAPRGSEIERGDESAPIQSDHSIASDRDAESSPEWENEGSADPRVRPDREP